MGTATGAWTGSAKKVVRCGGSAGAGAGAWVSTMEKVVKSGGGAGGTLKSK